MDANMFASFGEAGAEAHDAVELEDLPLRLPERDIEGGFGASQHLAQFIQRDTLGDIIVAQVHRRVEVGLLLRGKSGGVGHLDAGQDLEAVSMVAHIREQGMELRVRRSDERPLDQGVGPRDGRGEEASGAVDQTGQHAAAIGDYRHVPVAGDLGDGGASVLEIVLALDHQVCAVGYVDHGVPGALVHHGAGEDMHIHILGLDIDGQEAVARILVAVRRPVEEDLAAVHRSCFAVGG